MIICETVRFRLAVLTTRKTRRVVGRSQAGLLLTLFERSTGVSSMQKVVRVHYLSFARDGTKLNGLHNPLHRILPALVFLINAGGFCILSSMGEQPPCIAEDVGSIPAGYVAYGQKQNYFSLSYTNKKF